MTSLFFLNHVVAGVIILPYEVGVKKGEDNPGEEGNKYKPLKEWTGKKKQIPCIILLLRVFGASIS